MSSTKKQVPHGLKGAEDSEEANRGDEDNLNLPDPQRGDALGSSPQPSANDSKMAPILLKNPPVQAMNSAAGHLPSFKDQARSIAATATATAASATRATNQSTENAASGHLPSFKDQARIMTASALAMHSTRASNNNSHQPAEENLKDGGPDFKDQVRSGRPPPAQQQQQRKSLPSAQGVPVESTDQEPQQATTVVAVVLQTMEGDNENPVVHPQQFQQQLQENREPPANNGATRVRKRLFWAAGILLVVVAVVVGVVVALVLDSSEEEESMVFAEETKLTASDGAGGDGFGIHVAIDEDTVVVGAFYDDDNGEDSGSVFVFTRMGTTWTEQAKLMAGDGAAVDDQFGSSVAIAGDTIVVGAHLDDDNGTNSGSAYVYTRTGTTWTEQAKLTASDGAAGDQFGFRSVAIEGDTIVVGAYRDDDNGKNSGTAFVFTRMGTTWTEQAKLTASDGAAVDDQFGRSVAIAGDTIVVGATPGSGINGSVFVFTRTGTTWTEQDQLTSTSAPDFFGARVAIAGDTVVVGADREDDNGTNSGTVIVYTRTGTVWTQQAKLKASDAAGDDRFGVSVAIAGDTIVVGADWDDENATNSGSVYVFMRMEGEWTQQAKLTASDGGDVEDQFGISVGIASGTIVVGAWKDDTDNGVDSGSAYVYDLN